MTHSDPAEREKAAQSVVDASYELRDFFRMCFENGYSIGRFKIENTASTRIQMDFQAFSSLYPAQFQGFLDSLHKLEEIEKVG